MKPLNTFEQTSWYRLLIILGGGALFFVMLVEVVAVAGRAVGLPLLGAIELVQWLIAVSSTLSMLVATLHGSHAMVKLIVGRLNPVNARRAELVATLISAVFFVFLWLGCMWLTVDLWAAFEESELWHLPFKPLRILVSVTVLLVAISFVIHSFKKVVL